jgi:hypothetical protein
MTSIAGRLPPSLVLEKPGKLQFKDAIWVNYDSVRISGITESVAGGMIPAKVIHLFEELGKDASIALFEE